MTASLRLLSCLLVTAGCNEPLEPCYGTKAGQEYDIELLERWDEDSSYAGGSNAYGAGCGPDFDIWEGDRVRILVEGHEHHNTAACENAVFHPVAPEQYGWEILSSRSQGVPAVFFGQFDLSVRECDGGLVLEVDEIHQAPNLYSASKPPSRPYFSLSRRFIASGDCPALSEVCDGQFPVCGCGDAFVVQIHPVE